jgi:hypothetical protein
MRGMILMNEMSQPSVTERLTSEVQARLHGAVHDFRIQFRNDCLVLTGWTHTYYSKQLAQQYVMAMTHLGVTNEIQVADAAPPRS